jgi:hypothetical protein
MHNATRPRPTWDDYDAKIVDVGRTSLLDDFDRLPHAISQSGPGQFVGPLARRHTLTAFPDVGAARSRLSGSSWFDKASGASTSAAANRTALFILCLRFERSTKRTLAKTKCVYLPPKAIRIRLRMGLSSSEFRIRSRMGSRRSLRPVVRHHDAQQRVRPSRTSPTLRGPTKTLDRHQTPIPTGPTSELAGRWCPRCSPRPQLRHRTEQRRFSSVLCRAGEGADAGQLSGAGCALAERRSYCVAER